MIEQKIPKNSLLNSTLVTIREDMLSETLKQFGISNKCILILDNRASIFLSSFFKFSEIINLGFLSIESIYKKRKSFPDCSALYIISGNKNSINSVLNDFDPKETLYDKCHIFLIDEVEENLLDLFVVPGFVKKLKTLKLISIKYSVLDKNLFCFSPDQNFNSLYNLYYTEDKLFNNLNISRLFSICKITKTYPNIVYFNQDSNCKYIARQLNDIIKKYNSKIGNSQKNGIVFITSRLIDLTGPLQFDYIYQHLIFEKFKCINEKSGNKIKFPIGGKTKEIELNYKDVLFNKYKSMPIYECMAKISTELSDFLKSDIGKNIIKIQKGDDGSLDEIENALQNVNYYNFYYGLLELHINISHKINEIKEKLYQLMEIQKSIIGGCNREGKKISEPDLVSMLKENKNQFNKDDFLRLLCLVKYYFPEVNIPLIIAEIEKGSVKFSDIDKQIISCCAKKKCLIDLEIMKSLDRSIILHRGKYKYDMEEEKAGVNDGDKRFICTRESKLTTLCDMCCRSELPKETFEFVEGPQNLPKNKGNFHANIFNNIEDKEKDEDNDKKQNLILFNVGGLSNYEVSSIDRGDFIDQFNMNVIFGSNKIYNYQEYFKEIIDNIDVKNGFFFTKEEKPDEINENNTGSSCDEFLPKEKKSWKSKDKKNTFNANDFDDGLTNTTNEGKDSKSKLKKHNKNLGDIDDIDDFK